MDARIMRLDRTELVVDGNADGLKAPAWRGAAFSRSARSGMADLMMSTSSNVVSIGRSERTRSIAAAI